MNWVFITILLLSLLVYSYFVVQAIFGLKKPQQVKTNIQSLNISIIIPFRNEGNGLQQLEDDLISTLSNFTDYEVIWVNDHSIEGSFPKIKHQQHQLLSLQKGEFGKKKAIKKGIEQAQFDRILSLDADIQFDGRFFESISKYWTSEVLICPVITRGKGVLGALIETESLALTGLSMGLAIQQNPILCNGAAWGYNKALWESISIRHEALPSGDDLFTLEAIKQQTVQYNAPVIPHAVVQVEAPNNLSDFINQRVRWAKKTALLKDRSIQLFSWSSALLYASLIVGFLSGNIELTGISLIALCLKSLCDYLLLFLVSSSLSLQNKIWTYPLLTLVYPAYALFIVIIGLFYKPQWKGR